MSTVWTYVSYHLVSATSWHEEKSRAYVRWTACNPSAPRRRRQPTPAVRSPLSYPRWHWYDRTEGCSARAPENTSEMHHWIWMLTVTSSVYMFHSAWMQSIINNLNKNTLDCNQFNYSLCIFSYIPTEFGPTGNNAIRSADPKNATLEPNMQWIKWSVADTAFRNFPNER